MLIRANQGISIVAGMMVGMTFASASPEPAWWRQPATAIIDVHAAENNHAPVAVGQLKHVATRAKLHFDTTLAGGAGAEIDAMVGSFQPDGQGDLAPANLGQLKSVAAPFYDRLIGLGLDSTEHLRQRGYPSSWPHLYPWDPSTPVEENYKIAAVGQLKMVFSFDLDVDLDGNGLPDWWEIQFFGSAGVDSHADFDGDGWSNSEELLNGTDPTVVSITGWDGPWVADPNDQQAPTVTISNPPGSQPLP